MKKRNEAVYLKRNRKFPAARAYRLMPAVALLILAGCKGDGWTDAIEAELRRDCTTLMEGSGEITSHCVAFVKDRVDGADYERMGLVARIDLMTMAALDYMDIQFK